MICAVLHSVKELLIVDDMRIWQHCVFCVQRLSQRLPRRGAGVVFHALAQQVTRNAEALLATEACLLNCAFHLILQILYQKKCSDVFICVFNCIILYITKLSLLNSLQDQKKLNILSIYRSTNLDNICTSLVDT